MRWSFLFRSMMREDAAVEVATGEQLFVGATVDEFALAQDKDSVGPANLREAMGDEQRGAALQEAANGSLYLILCRAVDGAGGVVENQDARVGEQGASDGDALALAAGERDAALADHRLIAFLEAEDELVRLRVSRRPLDRRLVHLLAHAVGNVLGHRA